MMFNCFIIFASLARTTAICLLSFGEVGKLGVSSVSELGARPLPVSTDPSKELYDRSSNVPGPKYRSCVTQKPFLGTTTIMVLE